MAKQRVAILGGGVGSLSTAWALTATPELREAYDVTVYSLGWRLGGKGATGRRREDGGLRVEEHGLHVWLGFYENAFAVLREAYDEMRARGLASDSPFQSWRDALKAQSFTPIGLGDGSTFWDYEWPTNADVPGEGGVFLSPWGAITEAVSLLEHLFKMVLEEEAKACLKWFGGKLRHDPIDIDPEVGRRYREAMERWQPTREEHQSVRKRERHARFDRVHPHTALKRAHHWLRSFEGDHTMHPHEHLQGVSHLLDAATGALRQHVDDHPRPASPLHLLWEMMEIAAAVFRGITNPKYGILKDWDLNRIDGYELLEWLVENGAPEVVGEVMVKPGITAARQPALRALYDLAFAYEKTKDTMVANFAAGTALRVMIRTAATYKEAVLFEMQSGMGEVIVSPIYLVLKDRGVKFELFRKVRRLELSEDKNLIQRVHMDRQVDYVDGSYDPIFYSEQGIPCWPSEPFWDRIVDGAAMKDAEVNWESSWNQWPAAGDETIELGRDFDDVVLGISLGVFKKLNEDPSMCQELMDASPAFAAMTDGLGLVPTEANQLWMTRTLKRLGWTHAKPAAVGAVEPIDIWADMSQVLAYEQWRQGEGPKSLHYLCGPLNTWDFAAPSADAAVPDRALRQVSDLVGGWLERNAKDIWPDAVTATSEFDWDVLFAPGATGRAKLDAQYLRANVDPTECCVTSVRGSTRVRLWAHESGFDNLYLSGDWARSGLNTAGVESAIMAGLEASKAICGHPETIVGGTFMQGSGGVPAGDPGSAVSGSGLPTYVTTYEYGEQVAQVPGLVYDATTYMFALESSDPAATQKTVDHFLNAPADGAVHYQVLGSHVFISFLAAKLTSIPQAIGWIPDHEAALWVPLLGTTGPDRSDPRLVWWNPYLILDNGVGTLTGREVWGFRKEIGSVAMPAQDSDPMSFVAETLVYDPLATTTEGRQEVLIAVEREGERGTLDVAWHDMKAAWREVRDLWEARQELEKMGVSGLKLLCSIVDDLLHHQVGIVNLKQFRDAEYSAKACYQAIIEGPCTVKEFRGAGPLAGEFRVTIPEWQSHRIVSALGLPGSELTAEFGWWVKMDFTADPGKTVWRAPRA
ncbi:MAG: NAD(P)-binding protein [Gemmatimonadota bacterium]